MFLETRAKSWAEVTLISRTRLGTTILNKLDDRSGCIGDGAGGVGTVCATVPTQGLVLIVEEAKISCELIRANCGVKKIEIFR